MSNGQVCCLRRICCPPLEVMKAWTRQALKWITSAWGKSGSQSDLSLATEFATRLLAEHDPAPLGTAAAVVTNWGKSDAELGAAIRVVYQSTMDEAAAHEHGQ